MGLNRYYPILTERMGAMLCVHGIQNAAMVEFGPMGTANYYEMSCGRYGIERHKAHFAVHTTDMDISLGRYSHLIEALQEIEETLKPEIIFIFASSIMNVVGVDIAGIMCEAADSIHTPVLVFPGCSFGKNFMSGMEYMMTKLAERSLPDREKKPRSYAILGSVPDDFHFQSDREEIFRMMQHYFGAQCSCSFPFSCTPEEIRQLGGAEVNLVLRQEALKAAELLQQKNGTPYVFFRPYGVNPTLEAVHQVEAVTGWKLDGEALKRDAEGCDARLEAYRKVLRFQHSARFDKSVLLYGNYDTVKGIAGFLSTELGLKVFPRAKASFSKDVELFSEETWDALLEAHPNSVILADGDNHLRCPERAGIISSPAVKYQDLTWDRPLIGFRGALNILQLVDDCRP